MPGPNGNGDLDRDQYLFRLWIFCALRDELKSSLAFGPSDAWTAVPPSEIKPDLENLLGFQQVHDRQEEACRSSLADLGLNV